VEPTGGHFPIFGKWFPDVVVLNAWISFRALTTLAFKLTLLHLTWLSHHIRDGYKGLQPGGNIRLCETSFTVALTAKRPGVVNLCSVFVNR
jgi:hypothetical protein